jgi:threonine/homoserine/homoserine lactone efflux protein
MGQAIGQMLPLAVGVALSPVPIIAVGLMLVTPRARVNGSATWVDVLKLVLGLLLLLGALKQWRGRPHGDDEPATPKWMGAIEGFGPGKALVAGAVLAGANPKNTLLAIAAAASIAATGIGGGEEAVAYLVFALIGTVGVAAPVVIYLSMGTRAGALLDGLKRWMARNNAVIMAVLLLVIGAKLVGEAISGFSS